MLQCQDGGARCLHIEDDIELGDGAMIPDVVTVRKVAVTVLDAAYDYGRRFGSSYSRD